tara:strand:- start:3305 stop:3430 length:126 start_codon:yes stop_codon:yes gene_type:complete
MASPGMIKQKSNGVCQNLGRLCRFTASIKERDRIRIREPNT